MGEKNSLTEWPENLKEVIDWFLRVGGKDKESQGDDKKSELQRAVEALPDYSKAKEGLGGGNVAGLFNEVGKGLQQFIGYSSLYELDGSGIALQYGSGYTSSYSKQAKWNNGGGSNETYAEILLSSTPLLYYGLTFVYWMCIRGGWREENFGGGSNGSDLHNFLSDLGYSTGLKSGATGQTIAKLLGTGYNAITDFTNVTVSDSPSYPDFLKKLQEHGKPKLPNQAMSAPLYVLYAASTKYLQSKLSSSKIKDLPQTQSDISKTLKGYSEAVKALNPGSSQKLSDAYNTLLTQIQSQFNQDPPPPPSSSAGAAAGGILGTAALGTTAALATNVGGITTTLKNFIPIFR
ncbi:variant erythrocyte surface antigen-1 family protein [Babesia caballi]|uniref:Variant erythrocyte surface antigen-1 family protein n=1 Tax=Babesia caballi TaxID=5871 RepID=A0AAV4LWZ6_BABCB|nr:variant erythrocyte surface antigen-1 family protein [Babesia caballi]